VRGVERANVPYSAIFSGVTIVHGNPVRVSHVLDLGHRIVEAHNA
jgi:hypothetical protein